MMVMRIQDLSLIPQATCLQHYLPYFFCYFTYIFLRISFTYIKHNPNSYTNYKDIQSLQQNQVQSANKYIKTKLPLILTYLLFIQVTFSQYLKIHKHQPAMSNDENIINMNVQFGNQSVNYFYKQGKITEDQYNQISGVINSLFKVISDSIHNYNTLSETMRKLKGQLKSVKFEAQQANARQSQASENTQKLSRLLKNAEVAYDSQRATYENLLFDSDQLAQKVTNREHQMKEDLKMAESKMQPIRDKYNSDIQETKNFNDKTSTNIQNLQRILQQNMQKINNHKVKNKELQEQEEKLKQAELKIKDSPNHYAKSAENLEIQIVGMNQEINDIKQEIMRKTKICETFREKKNQQKQQIQKLIKEREAGFQEQQQIATAIDRSKNLIHSVDIQRGQLKVDIMNQQVIIESQKKEIKVVGQAINKTRKQIEKLKKNIKKQNLIKTQYEEAIFQAEMITQKIKKEQAIIHAEMRGQINDQQKIKEDILLLVDKNEHLEEKGKKGEADKKETEMKIRKMEESLTDLKKLVNNIQKEIKDSTAVRESMARKASIATNQVRQTREELKVKELLILDLTKKYQQTQNKLQNFKALYEQVKSARNKYVNLIQNSSQNLAELKQRIKILQNQLEISKNQSLQKNKTIQDYDHMLQLQIHKRDQTKATLNQYDLKKRQKKEVVDQNINQIQKLNMIILSLQKDMQNLRVQYEEACEHRNYTGIQLIDRNDELCILYEKSNVQENILRKSEVAVKGLEDQIRMIKIQISQMQRRIKVAQGKLVNVPELANRVLELQQSISQNIGKESDLSKQLEDPENKQRWRELQGQDPDQQALDAKIQILEERLNSKKQQLLEKELILDQVTNLSEKLKKDALDGRQSTLEVSEKINEFQSKLKDITRKMKAYISELSMCQANIIKFQKEKQELETIFQSAKSRMEEGLPPTPETEIQYLKMMRDKKRYQQERKLRLQKQMAQQNYPPFATKTTAQQRVNSYIPDQIGLPKPYGNHAPFMYQQPGANMRHFKKPKVKQIQI